MFAFTTHAEEEFAVPPNDGFVTDPGDSIPLKEEEELEQKMLREKRQTGLEFVTVILPTLGGRDIAHLAWELRTKWGIEQNGSGILLLIAREEGKTLIAPGKSHEKVLTDIILGEIIEKDILPVLRKKEYALAIERGITAIREHVQDNGWKRHQKSVVPTKKITYSIALLFLALIAASLWARTRKNGVGQSRHRRQ